MSAVNFDTSKCFSIIFVLALEAVEKLSEIGLENNDSETVHGLICLAAQLAFEVHCLGLVYTSRSKYCVNRLIF